MTRVVCTQHGPRCERLHVGDIVRVVANGLGFAQSGNVTAVENEVVTVNFPDGVSDLLGDTITDDLMFNEAELEKVSV